MLKLLRMEYVVNRRQMLITLAIFSGYFLYMAYKIASPRVFLVTTGLMIGLAMPFGIIGREDKFKTAALVCSLPLRRRTIVLAKYAAGWIAMGFGLAYALLLAAAFPFSRFSVAEILTFKSILICLFLVSILFGFIFPFTIRFGLAGIIIFLVGSQLLGIVALILAQLLGRQPNPLRTVITGLERGLRAMLHHEATPDFLALVAGAIVAMNAASFLLARTLYARRDL
jgi:ABC-type transport system involved in multi-copper enzyme maturation permease subunit